ncbi:MAG: PEP-CTERM sorting domain-containing protein [Motiliproteus sp.]|nr:PEP-CTERM sorting domain-containing protein [Motiliproteus sp.]MCW9051889.1 PEP-CTERM sorting domain-containing protein [Motiliproteus sp.]
MAMNRVKQGIKLVAAVALIGSASVQAMDATDSITDRYYGAGFSNDINGSPGTDNSTNDVWGSSSKYDISEMHVTRSSSGGNTFLEVKIDTAFAGRAGYSSSYNSNGTGYKYGDLFLTDAGAGGSYNPIGGYNHPNWFGSADDGSQTRWKYAFDLNGARSNGSENLLATSGMQLRELQSATMNDATAYQNAFYTPENWHSSSSYGRGGQFIAAGGSGWDDAGNDDSYNQFRVNGSQDWISFYFDVTGTILASADQIALRWAMTCANDIIEAVADLGSKTPPPPSIPEPATYSLLLASLLGLGWVRRRKASLSA